MHCTMIVPQISDEYQIWDMPLRTEGEDGQLVSTR